MAVMYPRQNPRCNIDVELNLLERANYEGCPVAGCAEDLLQELQVIERHEIYRSPYYRCDGLCPMSAYEAARRKPTFRENAIFRRVAACRWIEEFDDLRQQFRR